MTDTEEAHSQMIGGSASNELSAHRTSMAFERTAMAADRTLMAVARTSLSLIGFGFTIFQFFHTLQTKYLQEGLASEAPRRVGLAMISVGIVLLATGIWSRARTIGGLNRRAKKLMDLSLIHPEPPQHLSPAMLAAILQLLIGLMAVAAVAFRVSPI